MLTSIRNLFDDWHRHDVSYCHWKSTNHLGETIWGRTDLDVLVDPRMATQANRILVENGFRPLQTVPLRGYPGIVDYVCLDESGVWAHVHLHYQLVLGDRWVKAFWLPARAVLERSWFSEEFGSYVIDPRDELYLFCTRMALKLRRPFRDDAVWEELQFIRAQVKARGGSGAVSHPILPDLDRFAGYAMTTERPSRVRLDQFARRARRTMRAHRRLGPASFIAYSRLRQSYRYWVEFRRRVLKRYDVGRRRLPKGGTLVALIGIDGSGKTSAVRRMEALFAQQMNVERVFMGNGQSGATWYRRLLFAILGSRARLKGHRAVRNDQDGSGSHTVNMGGKRVPWYYGAWMLLCTSDKAKNLRRAIAARANGSLVLADRWPQVQHFAACDGPRLLGRSGLTGFAKLAARREERFYSRLISVRPDLIVRLVVTPNVATKRKPGEFTETEAEETSRILQSIEWVGIPVVDIDADAEIQRVDRAISSAVWCTVKE